MITNFTQISARLLEAVRENPDILPFVIGMNWQVVDTSFGPLPVRARDKRPLARMSEEEGEIFCKRNSREINRVLRHRHYELALDRFRATKPKRKVEQFEQDARAELSLDRAHCLHVLLCGGLDRTADPLGRAIGGGSNIGDVVGIGPARFLKVDEVRQTASVLSKVSEGELRSRLDSGLIDYELVTPGDFSYSVRNFIALRDYYKDAASRDNALILFETWFPPLMHF